MNKTPYLYILSSIHDTIDEEKCGVGPLTIAHSVEKAMEWFAENIGIASGTWKQFDTVEAEWRYYRLDGKSFGFSIVEMNMPV